jgi:hypothetical protein
MAVKISESEWVDFTKKVIKDGKLDPKLKLDDAALSKALAAYDKTDASKPEPHLKALDELIKQIPEQVKALLKRKKELGDKPFGQLKDKLYELLEAAEGQRKAAQDKAAEAKAAESKGKGKADEDDEEETPALLTTKMIPLLRELRKGEVTMPCLIALAGKETVLLISRKPISPARGKLLKEQMEKPTGLKFIRGDSMYDKGALTFVVQSPGAALAKRLRQALLDQTQLRLKVKVRGEDGVEELDGEEENLEQEGTQTQKAPPGGPASAEQLAYTQRLLKVRERYEQALKQQHPEATKLRALMGLASEKADEQKNFAAAIQALQALEKVLEASTSAPSGGVDPDAAFKARLTALIPRLKDAQTAGHPGAQEAKLKASEAGVFARKKDYEQANRLLDELESLLEGAAAPANSDEDSNGTQTANEAVARWIEEREKLASKLLAEIKEIAATKDPLVGNAELELRAVLKQIKGEMSTQQQAAEMERYLEQDDVVSDISELAFDLKTPLLKVLREITPLLPA